MKTLYRAMACGAAILSLAACDKSDENLVTEPAGSGRIILDISPSSVTTRAAADIATATDNENLVEDLDVLIFRNTPDNPATDEIKVYHERIDVHAIKDGSVELKAQRSRFLAGTKYWVYLIANATAEESEDFASLTNLTGLRAMKRTDERIHITGLWSDNAAQQGYTIQQTFLMDGAAFPSAEAEPAEPKSIVLNDGNRVNDTQLKVILRRAAVKLILEMLPGDNVQFLEEGLGYYMRNMPYVTHIVDDASNDVTASDDCRTTQETRTSYLQITKDGDNGPITKITVTMYAYSHSWESSSAIQNEPRWIPDVPMIYDDPETAAADPQVYPKNYYQIPVVIGKEQTGDGARIERNHCYKMVVRISCPGGSSPAEPLPLDDIDYVVWQDWEDSNIPIGGDTEDLAYLAINPSEFEMHNIDTDETTLRFASSSDVTATVKEAYFINKFGQKEEAFYLDENDQKRPIKELIQITPDPGMNGGIKVYSPVPANNTARYIVVEFRNQQEITPSTVVITQYPVINITNVQGWYSYRSDFGGTTWENDMNNIPPTEKRVSAYGYNKDDDTWQYYGNQFGSSYSGNPIFFSSKVVTEKLASGKSHIKYYYYKKLNDKRLTVHDSYPNKDKSWGIWGENGGNARMYHVQVRSTSGQYTVGIPRLNDKGITDPGDDNAKLVSPSFMLASQLGAVYTVNSLEMAASHCREYVEVDENKNVYDDWRLPTTAEIQIIINLQHNTAEGAAMDEVMTGEYYYSASGTVRNKNHTSSGTAIRCVRDAYEEIGDNKGSDAAAEAEQAGQTVQTASE